MAKANSTTKRSSIGKHTRFDGAGPGGEDFEAGSDVGEEFMKVRPTLIFRTMRFNAQFGTTG